MRFVYHTESYCLSNKGRIQEKCLVEHDFRVHLFLGKCVMACAFAHSERTEHGEVKALTEDTNYMREEIGILKIKLDFLATI